MLQEFDPAMETIRRLRDEDEEILLDEEEPEESQEGSEIEIATISQEELAVRRIQMDPSNWKIQTLYNDRHLFIPTKQQRDYVQSPAQASFMILCILYNLPMPPIMLIRKNSTDDSRYYGVSDGEQRLNNIWRFKDGLLKTPTRDQVKRVNPNCKLATTDRPLTYGQLSKNLQVRFDEYKVPVIEMELPPELESMMFANFNLHTQPSPGQFIWSYESKVSDFAQSLWPWDEHWSALYKPVQRFKEDRLRERILTIVEMLIIEVAGKKKSYIVECGKETLKRWGGGLYDRQVTIEHMLAVRRKLALMSHLFFEIHVKSRSFFVAMYQAVSYLDDMGYVLEAAPKGCLTKWIKKAATPVRPGEFTVLMHMADRKRQLEFWPVAIRELVSMDLPIEGKRGPLPDFSQFDYIKNSPPKVYLDRE